VLCGVQRRQQPGALAWKLRQRFGDGHVCRQPITVGGF
jgi:hypothetical protein